MTVDYWTSSQAEIWAKKEDFKNCSDNEPMVYLVNMIDTLADQLPKFVRNNLLHYTAMVYAHRFVTVTAATLDGEKCCEIAALALSLAIESDAKSVSQPVWDSALAKVFPCEVVHRGIASAVESGKGKFLEKLSFDLFVYHPFEPLGLLLAKELENITKSSSSVVSSVAIGILNSLYRTSSIVEQPPYLLAVSAVAGALLLVPNVRVDVGAFLSKQPVDVAAVGDILCNKLFNFAKMKELPLPDPPAVFDLPSPSGRTGRSVSRQTSRTIGGSSGRSRASSNRKRNLNEGLASLNWALLPSLGDDSSNYSNRSSQRRPITLSELKVLKEIARCSPPSGILKLVDVKLYSCAEQNLFQSGGFYVVSGLFDATGSQFDSVVRLLAGRSQLLSIIEQLLQAVLFLNELKICHYSIEPKNIMVSGDSLKIASLSTCSVLPSVPTSLPSHPYRAPELLLGNSGGTKDDPLSVDLWSLGCVIAEIARIFATRNRYEEPLFTLTDSLPEKVPSKCPVNDSSVYKNCRYFLRITECLNKGDLPSPDIWPGFKTRGSLDALNQLISFRNAKYADRNSFTTSYLDLRAYLKDTDGDDGLVTEIVKALLRWCPERRVNPRICLSRLIKVKSSHE